MPCFHVLNIFSTSILLIRNLIGFGCIDLYIFLFACYKYTDLYTAYTVLYKSSVQILMNTRRYKMKYSLLLNAMLLTATFNVMADEAKSLTVHEEVTINAPASKVWQKVSNFNDLGAWHPAVKTTEIIAGTNNKKGAERLLTLQDGGTIKERLLAYNAKRKTFKYSILEGVLPVSAYVSSVTVKPAGKDKSLVVWTGTFKRKDTSASPAEDKNDAIAVKVITGVYRGGLDNLKKISE